MSGLHVVFKVADAEFVIAAADVLHMESFTGATKVPGTRTYVAGLIQIQGRVVPVVDLRARFGLSCAEPTLDSRVVVVQRGERTVGLLADSAREVIDLSPAQLRPPPDVIAQDRTGFVKSVAQVGQRLIMLVDVEKVIGEEHDHGSGHGN